MKRLGFCFRRRLGDEKGFSMIEVLVALFVTSIGLLGLAALQLTSLRYSHNTHSRSQATFLAQDIVERLRAYSEGVSPDGDGNVTCNTACQGDITAWQARLDDLDRGGLPDGEADVSLENGFLTVVITWAEQEGSQSFTYSARL